MVVSGDVTLEEHDLGILLDVEVLGVFLVGGLAEAGDAAGEDAHEFVETHLVVDIEVEEQEEQVHLGNIVGVRHDHHHGHQFEHIYVRYINTT